MIYLLLKTLHILSAIVALGANLTYGFLIYKAEREPKNLAFMLHTIRWIDSKVANRAYMVVLLTGLLMVWRQGYSFSDLWIWLSLLIFTCIALMGITLYAPILKEQIRLAENLQTATASYQKIKRKSTRLGVVVTLFVIFILILMVVKPVLT